jgi:hypothetical protein
MTVITMSRNELTRLRVLIDVADGRLSATVEAAIAIVGAVRTKTLLMLVPRRMRDVRIPRQ